MLEALLTNRELFVPLEFLFFFFFHYFWVIYTYIVDYINS